MSERPMTSPSSEAQTLADRLFRMPGYAFGDGRAAELIDAFAKAAVERERTFEFGLGRTVVNVGHYNGKPAIFIASAKQPGEVGASALRENLPTHDLTDGEMVLVFQTEEQAQQVEESLIGGPATPAEVVQQCRR